MAIPRVRVSFSRYSIDALDNKAAEIIAKMTNNTNFTSPFPPIVDVQAALAAYQQSVALGPRVNPEQSAERKMRRATLLNVLKRLALYVENVANGNEVALASSGFDMAKASLPSGILPKPDAPKLVVGDMTGTIAASVGKIAGAHSYLFEITDAPVTPASVWNVHASTRRSYRFTGLESRKEYAVRVAGVGADPMRAYSDIVSRWTT